jgi:hypothetical protein
MVRYVLLGLAVAGWGGDIRCKIENERIYCTYLLDRSDNLSGKRVEFRWISPTSPIDDRIRHFDIPPRYGSVYDYRYLPGRAPGKWRVRVTDLDTNETTVTTFEINATDETMFEEDE